MSASNLKIKKGDTVRVRSGKEKGKQGAVTRIDVQRRRIAIEGLHLVRKHVRPKRSGQKGERVSLPRAIAISKVMLVCSKCGEATRVGYKFENGVKVRVCKKCSSET